MVADLTGGVLTTFGVQPMSFVISRRVGAMAADHQAGLLRLDLHLTGLAIEVVVGEDRLFGHDLLNLDYSRFRIRQYLQVRPDHYPLAKLFGEVPYDLAVIGQLLGVIGVYDQLWTLELQPRDVDIRGQFALHLAFELKKYFFY